MHENNYSIAKSQTLPPKVSKGPGQSKKHMRDASLAKPKVTEAATLVPQFKV